MHILSYSRKINSIFWPSCSLTAHNAKTRDMGGVLWSINTQNFRTGFTEQSKVKVASEKVNGMLPLSPPDFKDHREAYKSKSMFGLLRAFVVFQLCTLDSLVDRQLQILRWCRSLMGRHLFKWTMKKSLFGQFIGGETKEEVSKEIEHNAQYGVQVMLCYLAAEHHGDGGHSTTKAPQRHSAALYSETAINIQQSIDLASSMPTINNAMPSVCAKMTSLRASTLFNYKTAVKNTKVDVNEILQIQDTLQILGQRAQDLGVVLIWDAEQTYLQTAMDVFTLDSMRYHNKYRAVIQGTYQCYLKNALAKLTRDTDLAEREGFCWSGKVVRGAYMDEERRLASLHRYEDPVNPTYEATTDMYHKVVEKILALMIERQKGTVDVTVATHNVDTVTYILGRLSEVKISPANSFRFSQIMGMRDHITFCLGQSGIPVSKLVHYGAVENCIAWLSRRVTENRSGISTANWEREMLKKELIDRIKQKG